MNDVANRIDHLLALRSVPERNRRRQLANVCGIAYQSVRAWFTGDTANIETAHLVAIAKEWDSSLDWLATGVGQPYKGENITARQFPANIDTKSVHDTSTLGSRQKGGASPFSAPSHGFVEMPLYHEQEQGSNGTSARNVKLDRSKTLTLPLHKDELQAMGIAPDKTAWAIASGDSMAPEIRNGGYIAIDQGRTQIKDGRIFLIDHDGILQIRHLFRVPGGGIRLHCENEALFPDDIHTEEYRLKHIRVLGWVFWVARTNEW